MHVVAIIQARMQSTRLPGKVLLPIAGKPLLWHIVHRLHMCKMVDQICLAIPESKSNDLLEKFAAEQKIEVFRGSEDNVLERYYLAAKKTAADIVIRVNGDAPLIDPQWLDYLVSLLIEKKTDSIEGDPGIVSIHQGFTPVTFRALEKIAVQAKDDPAAREHVTSYLEKNPGFVSSTLVRAWPQHRFAGARLSVDTPADLEFMEELYRRLQVPAGEADLAAVVELLNKEPGLLKINAHVHQKGANEKTRKILFRCDGGEKIGFGHLTRCLALAGELRNKYGCGISFAMSAEPTGQEMVRQQGYHLELRENLSESDWLAEVVDRIKPDAVIFDYRGPSDPDLINKWRKEKIIIANIDDPTEKRLLADLNFYPPVPQVGEMNWEDFKGKTFTGWQWVVLCKEFAVINEKKNEENKERPLLLVTMGGSDPLNLTLKALRALDSLTAEFKTEVLLGPGYSHYPALENFLKKAAGRYHLHKNLPEVGAVFVRADLAVASFGVTAYELAEAGVPSLLLGISEDHVRSASSFETAGIGYNLGLYSDVSEESIRQAVLSLLADQQLRQQMAVKARELVDGGGAERIAAKVFALIQKIGQ